MKTRLLLPSLLAFAVLGAPGRPDSAWAYEGVFQASAPVAIFGGIGTVSLPQYSGPLGITSVTLTFNGYVGGGDETHYFFDENDGLNIDPFVQTADVLVFSALGSEVLDASGLEFFPGITAAPIYCDETSASGCIVEYTVTTNFGIYLSGSTTVFDGLDFVYINSFGVLIDTDGDDPVFSTSGTLTETITFTVVPEPSTWAMMWLGLVGLGFMSWRGSRKASTSVT